MLLGHLMCNKGKENACDGRYGGETKLVGIACILFSMVDFIPGW